MGAVRPTSCSYIRFWRKRICGMPNDAAPQSDLGAKIVGRKPVARPTLIGRLWSGALALAAFLFFALILVSF